MVIQSLGICVCCTPWQGRGTESDCVCAAEDYLRDGLNKTDAIVSSLDLNQAVAEVIPVVFPLTKKGCLLFLVKLRNRHHLIIALSNNVLSNVDCTTSLPDAGVCC